MYSNPQVQNSTTTTTEIFFEADHHICVVLPPKTPAARESNVSRCRLRHTVYMYTHTQKASMPTTTQLSYPA
jgi:hypothetical protein